MTSSTTSYDDEISLADLVVKIRTAAHVIWTERRKLAIKLGLAGSLGLIIAITSPVEFSASMRLLPYRGGGGGSGLSGLAGLAGIRLPTGSTDQTITADLYPEVVKSLDFRIKIAETPLRFSTLDRQVSTIEYFRDIRSPSLSEVLASYSVGLPGRLRSLLKETQSGEKNKFSSGQSAAKEGKGIREYDQSFLSLVEIVGNRLSISIDKKTAITVITAKMPDRYAAADLVRVSADQLMKQIIEYESQKAGENFRFVNEQYQEAKMRYERAQRNLAIFIDGNRALMSATSQISRDRLQREYDMAFEVYQQFAREREQARIKMQQDTPVFMVLDHATVPNIKTSPNRPRLIAFAMLIGVVIGIAQIGLDRVLRPAIISERLVLDHRAT